jgi:cell division protein FtsQ
VIDSRIAERRAVVREQRRRVRLKRTIWLLVIVAVVGTFIAIERSALVGLEEVQVVGTDRLDPDEVRAAADLDLGTSTLRLGLGAAEERVTDLPLVQAADASRLDPLTVVIEVEERTPALVVRGGDQHVLLDRQGVLFAEEEADHLTPIDLEGSPPPVGEDVTADPALANAFDAWRGLSGPLRAEVQRYEARGPDELSLRLDSGIEVRFGRADRVDEKVRALGAVLGDIGEAEVEVIDVRAPSAPVVIGG